MSVRPNLPAATAGLVPGNGSAWHPADLRALAAAVHALEHTNFATRLTTSVGRRLGSLDGLLPPALSSAVNRAAEKAIAGALAAALRSLGTRERPRRHSRFAHKAAVTMTGAAGGFFGLASLPLELPISTIVILRAIAGIARSEGEDLSDPETAIACLQVFALGAHVEDGEFIGSGYFAVRGLLAKAVSEASRFALERGVADQAAPVLLKLVSLIGARFGIVVSQKLAVQAVPVLGAAGGAAINYAFAAHFQSIASGHFTIRRLERIYGAAIVRAEYERLRPAAHAAA
ncbi:MAG: EcsC family protein [Beijerinckiaceae bacterium]